MKLGTHGMAHNAMLLLTQSRCSACSKAGPKFHASIRGRRPRAQPAIPSNTRRGRSLSADGARSRLPAATASTSGQAAAGCQRSIREWLKQTATPTRVAHTTVQRPVLPNMSDAVRVDGIPTWPGEANATSAGGTVDHPIIIDSDDEATLQPHHDQHLLPEVVIDAQLLLQPMRDALVYERFRSESTRPFEARGAVMLGMHADCRLRVSTAGSHPGPSSAQGDVASPWSAVRKGPCSAPA